ncbi:sentrin-specific protease 7-like [Copidosoma floridanum]|uniref:sentrin-specific protease 7-like n=1 Tax=Copidosoma floridanum TaxID=29053 RepID=UPI000C6F9544|nr:sentrin-specific protease 7-like [Copidosoma floridanum]
MTEIGQKHTKSLKATKPMQNHGYQSRPKKRKQPSTEEPISISLSEERISAIKQIVLRDYLNKAPSLLIFNSISKLGTGYVEETIINFIKSEFKKQCRTDTFNQNALQVIYVDVPQQKNSSDCGLYMLQYVENFFKDTKTTLDAIPYLHDWFDDRTIMRKRRTIESLILEKASKFLNLSASL